jgi:hypothetical protein
MTLTKLIFLLICKFFFRIQKAERYCSEKIKFQLFVVKNTIKQTKLNICICIYFFAFILQFWFSF